MDANTGAAQDGADLGVPEQHAIAAAPRASTLDVARLGVGPWTRGAPGGEVAFTRREACGPSGVSCVTWPDVAPDSSSWRPLWPLSSSPERLRPRSLTR